MTHPTKPSMNRSIILSVFMGFFVVVTTYVFGASTEIYNQVRYLLGTGGEPHNYGSFSSTGNAGTITFGAQPTDGYSGAHLFIPALGDQVFTGSFWSETIGWVNLDNIEISLTDPVNNTWSLSGYAWSEKAGWFDFGGVTYQLSNTSFSGYAWNDGIGWIDIADAGIDLTSSGAIGKVKIIGTAGSNRIFDVYDTNGNISATSTKVMNDIRKNVALLKRNIPSNKINSTLGVNNVFDHGGGIIDIGDKIFFENTGSVSTRLQYEKGINDTKTRIENIGGLLAPVYSVIVIGGDIHINDSIKPQSDGKPRVFIALKNEAGVGGNIFIDGEITQVYASLVAEGSLYSGEFSGTTPIRYNDDVANLFKIPNRQLYIYGTLISNNTIGGYRLDNGIGNTCPYNITPCTDNNALLYDFNHFRDFQKDTLDSVFFRAYQPPGSASTLMTYDDYSMIIEHDYRLVDTPPPGLENID